MALPVVIPAPTTVFAVKFILPLVYNTIDGPDVLPVLIVNGSEPFAVSIFDTEIVLIV
jgi:hypothetical protein